MVVSQYIIPKTGTQSNVAHLEGEIKKSNIQMA